LLPTIVNVDKQGNQFIREQTMPHIKAFSIQDLVETPTNLEVLRGAIRHSQIPFFLPVLNEAIFAMFESDIIDPDFLEDLQVMFDELLNSKFSGYRQIKQANFKTLPNTERRIIDRLINDRQPVIDSPYLGFHALQLCIKAINESLGNEYPPFQLESYISYFGEASEAVALSRITSSYVELTEIYYSEVQYDKDKYHAAQSHNALIKAENCRVKINQSLHRISLLAKKVWNEEPYIPHGTIAEVFLEYFDARELSINSFHRPTARRIKKYFKDASVAPPTAVYKGKPIVRFLSTRFENSRNTAYTYEIVATKLIEENFDSIFSV